MLAAHDATPTTRAARWPCAAYAKRPARAARSMCTMPPWHPLSSTSSSTIPPRRGRSRCLTTASSNAGAKSFSRAGTSPRTDSGARSRRTTPIAATAVLSHTWRASTGRTSTCASLGGRRSLRQTRALDRTLRTRAAPASSRGSTPRRSQRTRQWSRTPRAHAHSANLRRSGNQNEARRLQTSGASARRSFFLQYQHHMKIYTSSLFYSPIFLSFIWSGCPARRCPRCRGRNPRRARRAWCP